VEFGRVESVRGMTGSDTGKGTAEMRPRRKVGGERKESEGRMDYSETD